MSVIFACIAPHGTEIIAELAGDMLDAFAETRKGIRELAQLISKQNPETIVLATPHGLRLELMIAVVTSKFAEETLEANNKHVRLRCKCDKQLATDFLKKC